MVTWHVEGGEYIKQIDLNGDCSVIEETVPVDKMLLKWAVVIFRQDDAGDHNDNLYFTTKSDRNSIKYVYTVVQIINTGKKENERSSTWWLLLWKLSYLFL